jgi:hypothetical protein
MICREKKPISAKTLTKLPELTVLAVLIFRTLKKYSSCRIPIRHFFSQSRRLLTKNFESEATVNEKCRCCEFRGEGNKTGVAMLVISLSLLHKTRDTPNRVNREVSKIL